MRMWMIDPSLLCRKHLLGEHNEIHMLAGTLLRKGKLDGFIAKGLLEVKSMAARHEALAAEMRQRAYKHASPLPDCTEVLMSYPEHIQQSLVDTSASQAELLRRCPLCAALYNKVSHNSPHGEL